VSTWVALLRAVNVGGRKVPMAELRESLADLGLEDVRTYVQSGNVVFEAPRAAGLADRIAGRIEQDFGVPCGVILRTPAELRAIAKANPFPHPEQEPTRHHIVFLDGKGKGELDPDRSPGDEFAVHGREIYVRYASGAGRSKLSLPWFEKGLGVNGTARNWNTLLKLIELTRPT
jgi:uncharacterized protein (DUF1697 family)